MRTYDDHTNTQKALCDKLFTSNITNLNNLENYMEIWKIKNYI